MSMRQQTLEKQNDINRTPHFYRDPGLGYCCNIIPVLSIEKYNRPPKGDRSEEFDFLAKKIRFLNFSQQFDFWTIANCRGDFCKILAFSSKNWIFKLSVQLSPVQVIFGSYGLYFPMKTPYMGHADHILMVEFHIWVIRALYFLKKSLYMNRQPIQFWKRSLYWRTKHSGMGPNILMTRPLAR